MKFSIVTISYNQKKFLEKTIHSVINQGYQDLDYIIVDPGSNDGSHQIIRNYKDYFSHIILESDQGPADGLNKGFSKATGDIYGFLNADDVLLPGALKQVSEYFRINEKVDVVSGHCKIIDEKDREIRNSFSDKFSLVMHAYNASVLMQPSTFFRAKSYNKTKGFNIQNGSNWDSELFVDMYINGAKFGILNTVLSCYRIHSESITCSKKLNDKIKSYHRLKFNKIMGRDLSIIDLPIGYLLKFVKYSKNPRSLYQRLFRGTIYGRNTIEVI